MKLRIIDQNGWEKPVKLEQAVLRIGSAPTNDVHLDSALIAPVHLQVHYLPEKFGCKILNLGEKVLLSRGETQEMLSTYATTQVENGDEIFLGGYRIQFDLPLTTKIIQDANSLKASLSFPNASINQYGATIGWLMIQNIGTESPCQFHVSGNGIPTDCIQIDPVPLLYSGAKEEIRVQLFHRGLYPSAGAKTLTFNISAPNHYPREQVVIQQGIYVEPVFDQVLELFDDGGAGTSMMQERTINEAENKPNLEPPAPVSRPAPSSPPIEIIEKKEEVQPSIMEDEPLEIIEEIESEDEDENVEPPPVDVAPQKPVIVRSLPDDFWD